jgi:hypothetical protein
MNLRKLPIPSIGNCQEIWEKCVAIKAADGMTFYLNGFPCLNKWDDSEEDYPKGRHGYTIWTDHVGGKGMDVEHDQAHLVGWTFYENAEEPKDPLKWEGTGTVYCDGLGGEIALDSLLLQEWYGKRVKVTMIEEVTE